MLDASHPPVYYFPPEDIRPGSRGPGGGSSFCEWKGNAIYFWMFAGGGSHRREIWDGGQTLIRRQPFDRSLASSRSTRPRWMSALWMARRSRRSPAGSTVAGLWRIWSAPSRAAQEHQAEKKPPRDTVNRSCRGDLVHDGSDLVRTDRALPTIFVSVGVSGFKSYALSHQAVKRSGRRAADVDRTGARGLDRILTASRRARLAMDGSVLGCRPPPASPRRSLRRFQLTEFSRGTLMGYRQAALLHQLDTHRLLHGLRPLGDVDQIAERAQGKRRDPAHEKRQAD